MGIVFKKRGEKVAGQNHPVCDEGPSGGWQTRILFEVRSTSTRLTFQLKLSSPAVAQRERKGRGLEG